MVKPGSVFAMVGFFSAALSLIADEGIRENKERTAKRCR
jgi:hypothetical protein